MAKRFVCAVKYFPNCRTHDAGSDRGHLFFKNIEEVKHDIGKTYQDFEYGNLYDCSTGEMVAAVNYEFQRHELRKIEISRRGQRLEPEYDFEGCIFIDDGYGKKKWLTYEEYRNR